MGKVRKPPNPLPAPCCQPTLKMAGLPWSDANLELA